MKLRCTTDSIRLRVRKSDLEHLQLYGEVRVPIHFAPGVQLSYALLLVDQAYFSATFEAQQITVAIPREQGLDWINSEQVGLEYHQAYAAGLVLHVLIEKDFPCRHTESHDLEDTFYELAPKEDESCA